MERQFPLISAVRFLQATSFLDERQNVRPGEIGTISEIEEAATSEGSTVRVVELTAQFRCNGCGGYLDWVNTLMSDEPALPGQWLDAGEYDLRVYDTPNAMEAELLRIARGGQSARLVAGFCWPWSDPGRNGELVPDVGIGSWRRPWNEKPPEQRKPPKAAPRADRHPYTLWATEDERIREIGCIYTAQGLEFDYCGVILGGDLVWREEHGWVADKAKSCDSALLRRRLNPHQLLSLLQQTYRVLLTRGIKGTFIYSTDDETRGFLNGLIASAANKAD